MWIIFIKLDSYFVGTLLCGSAIPHLIFLYNSFKGQSSRERVGWDESWSIKKDPIEKMKQKDLSQEYMKTSCKFS